jgi:sugar phosphate isomerase/epimerase
MSTRREFLKASFATLAVSALCPPAWGVTETAVGLQLYSVRKQCAQNLAAVLGRVREIGYQEIETFSGLHSRPVAELKRIVADSGLRLPSGHFDYEKFETSFDYAHTLGLSFMVCPYLPHNTSLDDFKRAAEKFNQWGEKVRHAGMRFSYHNHNFEFRKFGNTTGFETLIANTDPKLVFFEIDCYWVAEGGYDPVQLIKSMPGRVRLLHLKDRQPGTAISQTLNPAAEHFTEIGTGTLDFKAIVAAARQSGVEHYFVEQDVISKPVYQSLTTSFQNAKRLLSD